MTITDGANTEGANTEGSRELREALARRLEFERLFGIEEVYVSAERRARAEARSKRAAEKVGLDKKKPPDLPAPEKAAQRQPGKAEPKETAPEGAEPRAEPAGVAGATAARQRPEFVIEEVPGAGVEEMSLFSEAEREGIPRVSAETGSNPERLARLAEAAGTCTGCHLARTRTNVVFGEGDPEADLVFVGEGPGADEDATGRPFVGRAGKLLTRIIEAMGLAREDVYICNVLKCRPPGNRTPAPEEVLHCSPFLHEQLGVIRPRVVCTLGGPATKELLGAKEGITKLRGRFFRYRGIPLMPTFHPAYLLRNNREKGKVWEDMQKILAFLERPVG